MDRRPHFRSLPRRRRYARRPLLAWILILVCLAVLFAPLAAAMSQGLEAPAAAVLAPGDAASAPLSSTAAVVATAWIVVYALKRYLAPYPKLAAVPVPVYLLIVSAGLTYYANQIAGTLPGSLSVLVVEVLKNAAITSGIREWATSGTAPLAASGVARQALERRI
jgi:hypothetical protein